MEIIDWIVIGVIIIFTIVVVMIIGWYVYLRKRPSKTTNETENSSESKIYEKPEIVVILRPHPSNIQCLMLCIENIGTQTAYNVRFKMDASTTDPFITSAPNLGALKSLQKNNFLRKGIKCFGHGQKIEDFFISLIDGLPEELKQPFQISVTYTDALNRQHENRSTFDFGDFESLSSIDSELKSFFMNIIQAGFSQDMDNIETSNLSQAPKSIVSETSIQEAQEHYQPVQNEQDKSLIPELQAFVDLYNAGDNVQLRQDYSPYYSIRVSNETERLQNPSASPIFQTAKSGSLVAYALDSESLYAVAPFSGCILQDKLYSSGAFGEVFECQGFHQGYKYHIKVTYPALFKYDHVNEEWTLEKKGKLELEEKHN